MGNVVVALSIFEDGVTKSREVCASNVHFC